MEVVLVEDDVYAHPMRGMRCDGPHTDPRLATTRVRLAPDLIVDCCAACRPVYVRLAADLAAPRPVAQTAARPPHTPTPHTERPAA